MLNKTYNIPINNFTQNYNCFLQQDSQYNHNPYIIS